MMDKFKQPKLYTDKNGDLAVKVVKHKRLAIAITGHTNIEKILGLPIQEQGLEYDKIAYKQVYSDILNHLKQLAKGQGVPFQSLILISGMARGVDEIFAHIAMNENLQLILAIPHSKYWHRDRDASTNGTYVQAIYYDDILDYERVIQIAEIKKSYGEGNHPFANFARNQWMVDKADYLLSYKAYDSTGTDDCIRRGVKQNKYHSNVFRFNSIKKKWARRVNKGEAYYEVSTKGDKRFSALVARLKDGRTIEEAYQLDVKGYRQFSDNWKYGKGKPPLKKYSERVTYLLYKRLWIQFFEENPELLYSLIKESQGKVLTDMFATSSVSQARAIAHIINDRRR